MPAKCPSCEVRRCCRGIRHEKVEEEIARLFPEARVARLDRDSVTSERAFNAIISDFEARKTDILVGTQMITKGFDFGGVSLVGILNADNLLNNPDFRAAERAFQLMLQVAGRAGRRSDGGEVVIQTSEPGHPVIRQVVAGDFAGWPRMQLSEREAAFYPPYARLTSLTLRHRATRCCAAASRSWRRACASGSAGVLEADDALGGLHPRRVSRGLRSRSKAALRRPRPAHCWPPS
ncbi:MAG: helicase-related protein [Alistipes finegoldii]